ncbi:hypothetical protein H5410_048223 [Solanum commersonii]|uniref:Uncharacterized protein n=1 Tax=Solanum commersonii TaxID=4109 RepID=A0A9J5XJ53_SOLCO|nr:hypothetical protein H5410_048223 [Solanum commersonii]
MVALFRTQIWRFEYGKMIYEYSSPRVIPPPKKKTREGSSETSTYYRSKWFQRKEINVLYVKDFGHKNFMSLIE